MIRVAVVVVVAVVAVVVAVVEAAVVDAAVDAVLVFPLMLIVKPVALVCASFIAACGALHRVPSSPKMNSVA